MKAALLGCILFVFASESFAHRLDEYLQATRIAVFTNRIELAFELTPGVAVASKVLELIDPDRDETISAEEGQAYAQRFLKDLQARLDDQAVTMKPSSVSVPTVQQIREGTGVIRIRSTLVIGPLRDGYHSFALTNGHLPKLSAYLVNALRSQDPNVEIGKQTRDELQKDYRLEFRVGSAKR